MKTLSPTEKYFLRRLDDLVYKTSKKIADNPNHRLLSEWQHRLGVAIHNRNQLKEGSIDDVSSLFDKPVKPKKPKKPKRVKLTTEQIRRKWAAKSLAQYYADPKAKEKNTAIAKQNRSSLSDSYIRSVILKTSNLKAKEIPQDLIDLVRKRIMIRRLLQES